MPTKKIADLPSVKDCTHPDHKPPTLQVFEDGIYEHTCPKCGMKTKFVVNKSVAYDDESPFYITGTEDGI